MLFVLLCGGYTTCRSDASTYDGIPPFTTAWDFSTPNEAYFAHVDRVLQLAASYGMLVFLEPAETGSWLAVMQSNGITKCRNYGRYLGQRYASFTNIIWVHGNDYGPPHADHNAANDALVSAVAQGIQDFAPAHLHTVQFNTNTSLPPVLSTDDTRWLPIITLNSAYTYQATYIPTLSGYNYSPPMPVFMIETGYEGEGIAVFGTSPQALRAQEYWVNLSGATGHFYGNRYMWQFLSGWQAQLNSSGATHMLYVKNLFEPRAWYNLVPDQTHAVVTSGYGTFGAADYVTAARVANGSLVMAYVPSARTVAVDMTKMGGSATARWYDPTNGTYTAIAGSPFANSGSHNFVTPGTNAGGDGDWVLVLEASVLTLNAPNTPTDLTVTGP
jgi:hypothetical protein